VKAGWDDGTRRLTTREAAILHHLLGADFSGIHALREQAKTVRARSEHLAPGVFPTSVKLVVDPSTPEALVDQVVPVEARATGDLESENSGDVLLFVRDGRLALLEFTYYGTTPTSLPAPELLEAPIVRS
jgi:hypothetical protein